MIQTKNIETLDDFKRLKINDCVICEFKRDSYVGNKKTRFGTYQIYAVKHDQNEIILQLKNNVYFNYKMFLSPTEVSNLKSIMLVRSVN